MNNSECSKDEAILADKRQKNLCIYVGKTSKKTAGVTTLIKHHYCCFSNILEKTIQIQARKQLGLNFGCGGSPDCRGLTLAELSKIDFSKIDFSEVAAEIHKKMIMPDLSDVKGRIEGSLNNNLNKFDQNQESHPKNKASGINSKIEEE